MASCARRESAYHLQVDASFRIFKDRATRVRTGVVRKAQVSTEESPEGDDMVEHSIVARIERLFARVGGIDLSPHVLATTRDELYSGMVRPIEQLLDEALGIASELESAEGADENAVDDFDLDRAFGGKMPSLAPADAISSEPQSVSAVCFAMSHELGAVRRELRAPSASHEQLLVACDRARRKLRRSLRALGEAHGRQAGRTLALADDWTDRVQAAVAVRHMYTKFREALPDCPDDPDPAMVARLLRRAATALAMLCGDEDFDEVRLHDRLLLRDLQTRTLCWGRAPQAQAGARLYADIRSAADLLRAINLRQELRAHDVALVEELRRLFAGGAPSSGDLELLAGRMRELRGLDDDLDALLRRAYRAEPLAGLAPAIGHALDRLWRAMDHDAAAAAR